jgi:hypothetical protein
MYLLRGIYNLIITLLYLSEILLQLDLMILPNCCILYSFIDMKYLHISTFN